MEDRTFLSVVIFDLEHILGIQTVINKEHCRWDFSVYIYVYMCTYAFPCRWVCMSIYTRMNLGLPLAGGSENILEIWIALSSVTYSSFDLHIFGLLC